VTAFANVEIVRRAMEAAYRRPKPDFETVNALFHPDHEFVSILVGLDGRALRGATGFREFLTTLAETWESYDWTFEEVSEIDEDRVLVVSTGRYRTRRGSVPMRAQFARVVTVRDGLLVRTEVYSSPEEALNAARARG
jgi:ketosteroid isomerase-like protein